MGFKLNINNRFLIKSLHVVLILILLMLTDPIIARELFSSRRAEAIEYRAMGGADIALMPSNTANLFSQTKSWNFSPLQFHASLTPPEIQKISKVPNLVAFQGMLRDRYFTLDEKMETFLDITNQYNLDVRTNVTLFDFYYFLNERHILAAGAFLEYESGLKLDSPKRLSKESVYISESEQVVDLGKQRRFFRAKQRYDRGVYTSYAHRFFLVDGLQAALAMKMRFFFREADPITLIQVEQQVSGKEDIVSSHEPFLKGKGSCIDLYNTFFINDKLSHSRISWAWENAFCHMQYKNDLDYGEKPRLGFGWALQPLSYFNNRNLILAVDLENIEEGYPGYQLGASYRIHSSRIGPKIAKEQVYFAPKIGFKLNNYDLLKDKSKSTTFGVEIRSILLQVAFFYEINHTHDTYQTGFSIAYHLDGS